MPSVVHDDSECVVYTENFRNKIHGNVVLPPQAFGKIALLDYLNQTEKLTLTHFTCYHRKGLDFVREKASQFIDYDYLAHIPIASICLLHGYPQYGFLSKADDERLRALSYEEVPVFLRYYVDPEHSHELILGRLLSKVHGVYRDSVSARSGAVDDVFKSRPRFLALRRPSNALLATWFNQEDHWKARKDHEVQPPSVILNQRRISLYGLQKLDAAAEK